MGAQRIAMLDPKFGSLYPDLRPGRWCPASEAAVKQAEHLCKVGLEVLCQGRVLPDEHFYFRGGRPRGPDWYVTPERLSDRTPAEVGIRGR